MSRHWQPSRWVDSWPCPSTLLDATGFHQNVREFQAMASAVFFVHLGRSVPNFTYAAMKQAKLFCALPVYLIAERRALQRFHLPAGTNAIAAETLPLGTPHAAFRRNAGIKAHDRDLWITSIDRFFYLRAAMKAMDLENALHLETDVMLYRDAAELSSVLSRLYQGLAMPFMDNSRVIPSIVFMRGINALSAVCDFLAATTQGRPGPGSSEMLLLRRAHAALGHRVLDALPILPENYGKPLLTRQGESALDAQLYSRHAREIGALFDAAAIGQYLGGTDQRRRGRQWLFFKRPIPPGYGPGFLNESSFVDPAATKVTWSSDSSGRAVPTIHIDGQALPLANLHVHSKNLDRFSSTENPDLVS
jgi:hypothetical protein